MQYILNYLAVQYMLAGLICSLCDGGLLKSAYKVIEKVCHVIYVYLLL